MLGANGPLLLSSTNDGQALTTRTELLLSTTYYTLRLLRPKPCVLPPGLIFASNAICSVFAIWMCSSCAM